MLHFRPLGRLCCEASAWRRLPRLRRFFSCATLLASLYFGVTATPTYAQSCSPYLPPDQRIGFNMTGEGGARIEDYAVAQLGAGWYHDYGVRQLPPRPGGIRYHQMVRGQAAAQIPALLEQLGPVIDANPGVVWLLGNEPDRYGQDELVPADYAIFYHELYHFIKARDPQSQIAIAGVVQPTRLRLRYLDEVLRAYTERYHAPMPVDIWDLHNFIMPENCDWGAGIPPGLEAYQSEGIACPATNNDHGNIAIFQQQLRTFRQWMADHGYRDRPLIVSEYGILLSKYHGYPYRRVRDFMLASFDFMLSATDAATGYPRDENRLVQEFAWFSLNYAEFDLQTGFGFNGNLFDQSSRQITPLGLDYANYIKTLTEPTIDLALQSFQGAPLQVDVQTPISFTVIFSNQGGAPAQDVAVRFWNGNPFGGGTLLGVTPLLPELNPHCLTPEQATFVWAPTQAGVYTIFAEITAANGEMERDPANNYAYLPVAVPGTIGNTPTPGPSPTPIPTPAFDFVIEVDRSKLAAGADLVYTFPYTNDGLVALNEVTFRLLIPEGTTLNAGKSDPGWLCLQVGPQNPCQFQVGNVASESSGKVKFALTLDPTVIGASQPVILTVQAEDRDRLISLERSSEVSVGGQSAGHYYLPLIQQ
jgi:uncharacterized repeat protein (TIGR01451 family)